MTLILKNWEKAARQKKTTQVTCYIQKSLMAFLYKKVTVTPKETKVNSIYVDTQPEPRLLVNKKASTHCSQTEVAILKPSVVGA